MKYKKLRIFRMRLTELCSVNLPSVGGLRGEASSKIFLNFSLKLNFLSNALGLRVINSIVVEL